LDFHFHGAWRNLIGRRAASEQCAPPDCQRDGMQVTMSLEAEAQLIARCRHGDGEAWDRLFDLHYGAAGRFIFQLSPGLSREDVEEICQETFLAVIRNIQSFKGGCRLQTWVFRIAANKARDYHQRQQAAKRGGGLAPLPLDAENPETGLASDPPSCLPGPDTLLLQAERGAEVARALEQLGAPCREIIDLRFFADLSYDEIGAELNLNSKTVGSRLSKCLGHLEKIMSKTLRGGESARFTV
jgi:RNA polymerase sigma-70 factor (ECF subfamily)